MRTLPDELKHVFAGILIACPISGLSPWFNGSCQWKRGRIGQNTVDLVNRLTLTLIVRLSYVPQGCMFVANTLEALASDSACTTASRHRRSTRRKTSLLGRLWDCDVGSHQSRKKISAMRPTFV